MNRLIFGILLLTLTGLCLSQLLTPFMVCEMQQMKLRGLDYAYNLDINHTEMQTIMDYCREHAYDHLGNQGTLG